MKEKADGLVRFLCFLALLVWLLFVSGCGQGSNPQGVSMDNLVEYKKSVREELPVGTSWQKVDEHFRNSGLEYSYSEEDGVFYALVRNVGTIGLIYETGLLIRVHIGDDRRVEKIEFELEHDGI